MYLRKMGSVSLLTREGEVEIAKRIEQGEHMVLAAILNSPVAVREIIDLGDKLRKHKIRVKDIIRDAETTTPSSTRRRPTAASCASSTR
jgi:RNA polymerase primary sigma factor